MRSLLLAAAFGLGVTACAPVQPVGNDLILVEPDDPAIVAATRAAERSLDRFLAYIAEDPLRVAEAGVQVKFPVIGVNADEHVWVTPFAPTGTERFTGILEDQPTGLGRLQRGDPVAFTKDQITDWYVLIDGREYGNFSTRALLPLIPEPDATEIRRILSDQPLPPGWR